MLLFQLAQRTTSSLVTADWTFCFAGLHCLFYHDSHKFLLPGFVLICILKIYKLYIYNLLKKFNKGLVFQYLYKDI